MLALATSLSWHAPNHFVARGFFPLFELCGSIMAMNLARRDILGDRMNRLQLFFVPVSLNAYAVFRVRSTSPCMLARVFDVFTRF